MPTAYVDTSCVAAIAFGEPGASAIAARLAEFDQLVASNLLEAELHSACVRTGTPINPNWTAAFVWLTPHGSMSLEFARALTAGYLRGADLWHVATALRSFANTVQVTFLTLDLKQRAVAAAPGLAT